MRPYLMLFLISCLASISFVLITKSRDTTRISFTIQNVIQSNCSELLSIIDRPYPAILVDQNLLLALHSNSCQADIKSVRLAVEEQHLNSTDYENNDFYNITFYKHFPDRDYVMFYDNKIRIIPWLALQRIGNLSIPQDPLLFIEFWKRSEFIECLNMTMNRSDTTSYLPIGKTLHAMSSFSKYLVSFGVYPFLNGGTLLGWYRECGIIPHTKDIDLAALAEEYKPRLLDDLRTKRKFYLTRVLGRANDSFEFTVKPIDGGQPSIDLFWMYSASNESWVGGTGGDGTKYKYSYPRYKDTCAADLLGHIFWIPCHPGKMIEISLATFRVMNLSSGHKTGTRQTIAELHSSIQVSMKLKHPSILY